MTDTTDSPERIWLEDPAAYGEEGRVWCDHNAWADEPLCNPVQYVRADLARPAPVRVKALEWREDKETSIAITPLGTYSVFEDVGEYWWERDGVDCGPFAARDDAKAAVPMDIEARILAAIEPAPVGWYDISTAPKDGTAFLAWHDLHNCPVAIRWVAEGIWTQRSGKMHWIEKTGTTGWPEEAFTHWMPLPPAPGEAIEPAPGVEGLLSALREVDELIVSHGFSPQNVMREKIRAALAAYGERGDG